MKQRITKRLVDQSTPRSRNYFLWDSEVTGFGLKVTPKGAKTYVFQYRRPGRGRHGKARRITLGRHGELTPDQARKIAAGLLVEVRAGGDPREERRPPEAKTIADMVERFLDDYLPRKKRPPRQSTLEDYASIFRCHVVPQLGSRDVAEITTADLEELHARMRSMPYQANRTLSVLHQAFDQAERWGWRPQGSNPTVHIDRYPEERRGAKKEVMLTPEQMADLLRAIDEEESEGGNPFACAAIRLAFWTGWRITEVLRLEWENVDLKTGAAKLLHTKTAKEEYRQLPEEAVRVLRGVERLASSPYVFPGRVDGKHLTTVRGPWLSIRRRAGLDELEGLGAFRIHDLRHNVVSWDVSRGVPLEIAGKNVGHRSRQATEIYAHFAPTALKQAADARARAMREAVDASREGSPS